ncbi:apical junction component 1 homolog [Rhinatrema bivittatum]|uniref:apical junction component 1 homolog n=1 Tax=Rhinatrema bivittatum TaxID=194408 RepID=UPI001129EC3B|nr:apical junction component 1 homolog [Rhinatrema bivittatum]XP_029469972.1 apical junction component 1 homolog [Rhinatrema bivittatum]
MTRTDPPDILVSTVYQDIKVNLPALGNSETFRPYTQCDDSMSNSLEHKPRQFNKRHCRSFDFLESLDDEPATDPLMEQPQRGIERCPGTPEFSKNSVGKKIPPRSSASDTFNSKQHSHGVESTKQPIKAEPKRRTRSKSAPRVKSTFTPVPIQMSSPPPPVRRGREMFRVPKELPKIESSPRKESSYASMKALMNEVHPIKLQPQRSNTSRISPLFVNSNCYGETQSTKPTQNPHVKCRLDIKPDETELQYASCNLKVYQNRMDVPFWQKQAATPRSLTVPNSRQISMSRTPTPSDSYSGEHKIMHFQHTPPNEFYGMDARGSPYQNAPHARELKEYVDRELGTFCSPNVPTTFFYTEEPGGFSGPPLPLKSVGYEGYSHPFPGHSISSQVFYTDDATKGNIQNIPSRTFYMEDPRPYPIQEAPSRIIYREDPRFYPPRSAPARVLYREDPRVYHPQAIPSRLFFAEDYGNYPEREVISRTYPQVRNSQPLQFNDWYFQNHSSPPTQTQQMSPFTPPQSGREAMLSSWHASYSMNQQRLGTNTRNYSKSWDNILSPGVCKEDPIFRGRSYENLLFREKRALSPDDRRQPVVVNLSCSPKRYAALSLSENSIIEKMHSDGSGRYSMGRSWFVTPEITITDNDIKANGYGRSEKRSASWDMLNSCNSHHAVRSPVSYNQDPTKETIQNSASRQRSLEQLDELIADLVIDYKPPSSRRTSEADTLTDQLRKLINDDIVGSRRKPELQRQVTSLAQPKPMKEQPGPSILDSDLLKEHSKHYKEISNSNIHKPLEECSPDLSADEDDVMMCSNAKCGRTETMFNACLYFKSCHSCYTYYCSRNCRREDWDIHKENCIYGRIGSICRHILKFCRENVEVHKAFSRIAKVGYLSRGRGVLFLGFPNPGSAENFLQFGLESLLMSPTYLSLRELEGYSDNLGDYAKELQEAGNQYDPDECFILNVTMAVGQTVPGKPSTKTQVPTVRKYAKIALASSSPGKKILKKEKDMETLILTPPPGTADIDKEGEEGRKAREVCFINIQRELRIRGVFLRHEFPNIYEQLCEFVESNKRFTPTTIYPIDKRTGKQFMCMIMAASEPRTLDWVASPNLLDDIM